ncbi:MAG: ketopantoate reductase family protein [Solirubrobacterales bacterium]
MGFDRVCVIGAGTIGSLIAGHVASQAEVSILTRREEHAAALNRDGLRIVGKAELHADVVASADPAGIPDFDLALVATKTTGVEDGIRGLRGRCPEATIVTVQNGLGSEQTICRYGNWQIVSGVTFISGIRHSDAVIEYELDTETWLGPYAGTETPLAVAEAVGDLFAAAGLQAVVLPDLLPAQWSKLLFNSAVNGVAALTELPHVNLYAKRETPADLGNLVFDLIAEGKAVAAAAGVELHDDPWEMNRLAVSRGESDGGDYAHAPSMLEDVLARRPTEIDAITGALVREAERVGAPAPLNTAMYQLIKAKEESWRLPSRTGPTASG